MQIIHQVVHGRDDCRSGKGCDDGEHDTALHCYHHHQGRVDDNDSY